MKWLYFVGGLIAAACAVVFFWPRPKFFTGKSAGWTWADTGVVPVEGYDCTFAEWDQT